MEIGNIIIVAILIVAGIFFLFLLMQRWFWILVFGISGLASAFATLASIFHFEILGAIGYFFLMAILWILTAVIAIPYNKINERVL